MSTRSSRPGRVCTLVCCRGAWMGSPHPMPPSDFRFDRQRGDRAPRPEGGGGAADQNPLSLPRCWEHLPQEPAPPLAVPWTIRQPESKRGVRKSWLVLWKLRGRALAGDLTISQTAPKGQMGVQGAGWEGPDLYRGPCGPRLRRRSLRAPRPTRFARVALELPPPPPPWRVGSIPFVRIYGERLQ